MIEMIDRAGEAFLDVLGGCVRERGSETVIIEACILRRQFDKAIRAAIAAMREPTEQMEIVAGRDHCGDDHYAPRETVAAA